MTLGRSILVMGRGLGIAAFCTLVFMSALELQVRWILPAYDPSDVFRHALARDDRPPLSVPNTVQRHRDKSGDFNIEMRINRHGLRDDDDIAKASPEDVIFLGDSTTMGFGIAQQDRFSDRINDVLASKSFNLAMPGSFYDFNKLLAYAEARGSKTQRLVIGVNVINSITLYDLKKTITAAEIDSQPPTVDETAVNFRFDFNGFKRFMNRYSATYLLFTSLIRSNQILDGLGKHLGLVQPQANVTLTYSDIAVSTSVDYLRFLAQGWDAYVLLIPNVYMWTGDQQAVFRDVYTRMTLDAQRQNLKVIDPLPLFDSHPSPEMLFFPNDKHLNAAGHAVLADALRTALPKSWIKN